MFIISMAKGLEGGREERERDRDRDRDRQTDRQTDRDSIRDRERDLVFFLRGREKQRRGFRCVCFFERKRERKEERQTVREGSFL